MAKACVDSTFFDVDPATGELTHRPGSTGMRQILYFRNVGVFQFNKADYPWLANVRVRAQAGGGGSASTGPTVNSCAAQPGAAGGGYAESFLPASALGATESVVVGQGGNGGVSGGDGNAGQNSSFGGHVIAIGGAGSPSPMTAGTTPIFFSGIAGPTGGTGQLVIGGGAGGGPGRVDATQAYSGEGGDSHLGHGGGRRASAGDGTTGRGYGWGAGGSMNRNQSNPVSGAAGGDGIVILELFA